MTENRSDRVFYQVEDGKLPVVVGQLQPTPRHLKPGLAVIRRRGMDVTVPVDALKYADTGLPLVTEPSLVPDPLWQLPDDPIDPFDASAWKNVAA